MSADQSNESIRTDNYYKKLGDVIQHSYFIASYQRGYRWDINNIKELLDDIFEGKLTEGNIPKDMLQTDPNEISYAIKDAIKQKGESKYCLQPLVVKWRADLNSYSVIDGQQRLTTLFVILKALSQISTIPFPKNFSLEYQSRPESKKFLDNLNDNSKADDIDAAYIMQAFDCAKRWFLEKNREFTAHILCEDSEQENPEQQNLEQINPALATHINTVLKDQTRFIWDEIDASSKEKEQKIFADRNTGKLELTDSELIKSLFMNPEYYGSQSNDIRDRQTLISEIWDIYENELHNAEFWAFLPLSSGKKKDYAGRTRIDAIFHILAMKEKEDIKQEENGLFKAIQNWIKTKRATAKDNHSDLDSGMDPMAQVMHQCWRDVCDLMDGIIELYKNNKIYNLLSLYKIIAADEQVLDMYLKVLDKRKNERSQEIITKITGVLFPNGISQCIKEQRYPSGAIKNILIAHNVAIMNTTEPIERFPFKFFETDSGEAYIWDREHIYASNEAYIQDADIEEQLSVLKLFNEKDSYKQYINYLYDLDGITATDSEGNTVKGIDAKEMSFTPSSSYSNFAAYCFGESTEKYDMYFDIWRYLKLKEISSDLIRRIDIRAEIEEILNEKNAGKQIQKLEDFFQNTDYDDGKIFIFLSAEKGYLFWDNDIRTEYERIKALGTQQPSTIRWHGYDVDIPNPSVFWSAGIDEGNFRRTYYRKLLNEIFDNTGIQSNNVDLENHGPRKPVIVNNNNLQLLISFVKGTKCRIDEKRMQFFIKGDHIDPNDTQKNTMAQYTTFADFINDNSMGNMMLLPSQVNRDKVYRSVNFDGKRKRASEMENFFIPIASTNVLLGKYNELGSPVRQWLMDERLKYLQDMIKTMSEYYK